MMCIFYFFSYDIEITDEIVGRAPIPELIVGVKQDGMYLGDHPFKTSAVLGGEGFPHVPMVKRSQ